jgi:hypothetical protein
VRYEAQQRAELQKQRLREMVQQYQEASTNWYAENENNNTSST